jgi:fructose-1,6-bisphosphatase/inositol monophosphatase family enzyme
MPKRLTKETLGPALAPNWVNKDGAHGEGSDDTKVDAIRTITGYQRSENPQEVDDCAMSCAAFAAALGDVGGHDAPVCLAYDSLYGAIGRRSAHASVGRRIYAFAAGYLIIWIVFSLGQPHFSVYLQRSCLFRR